MSARLASRKLTARYDAVLAPAGVSLPQFSLLNSIDQHGPASLSRLAAVMELDRSTLGRNMRVLKRMGLVAIRPGVDLREATLHLTRAGQEVLGRAMPLWQSAEDEVRQRLGAAGVEQVQALLAELQR